MIACKKMRKYCLFPIVLILTFIPCVLPAQGISPETNSLSSQLDTLIKYQLPAGSNVSVSAYDRFCMIIRRINFPVRPLR